MNMFSQTWVLFHFPPSSLFDQPIKYVVNWVSSYIYSQEKIFLYSECLHRMLPPMLAHSVNKLNNKQLFWFLNKILLQFISFANRLFKATLFTDFKSLVFTVAASEIRKNQPTKQTNNNKKQNQNSWTKFRAKTSNNTTTNCNKKIRLINFNGMSTLSLFYTWKSGNHVYYTFIFTFVIS